MSDLPTTPPDSGNTRPNGRERNVTVSRRRLLGYIGTAGAAALLMGMSLGSVTGRTGGSEKQKLNRLLELGGVGSTTIDALRGMTDPDASLIYLVTDKGQGGYFAPDPEDRLSRDNTGTVIVSASGMRFKRLSESSHLNVKWFGAKGDGIADDMAAIQRAIDAASAQKGGTVFFPPGTYIVSPSGRTFMMLRDNVNLMGEGTSSVIKIKDNAGDYGMMFSANSGSPLKDVRISHLRIDQNPSGNQTCNIDRSRTDTHYWQFVIGLYNYENIVIDNVVFDPTCGINTITLNKETAKNAIITNCRFNFVMAKGNGVYDNSAIYLNGRSHTVSNCLFYADPKYKARGAIETHTGTSVISNNVSDGYYTGINLQSSGTSGEHSDMTVTNNTVSNANQGIQFAPRLKAALKNAVIANNTIHLINTVHNRSLTNGISSAGSAEDVGSCENLTITGNTIIFEEELRPRAGLTNSAFGITLYRETDFANVLISGNIIKNAPTAGIRIGSGTKNGVCANVQVMGNMIINAGHYPGSLESYRAGIHLRGTINGALVSGNFITDTYDTPQGVQSIRVNDSDGDFSNISVGTNFVSTRQGGLWMNVSPSYLTETPPVRTIAAYPPVSGTYREGELVFLAAGQSAGTLGYRVTGSGTAGRLAGVTATGTAGKPYLTVSDSSQLATGQWIRIQAGNQLYEIVRISGNEVRLSANLTEEAASSPISFAAPRFVSLGGTIRTAERSESDSSAIARLEQEIALLKEALQTRPMTV